MSHCPRCNGDLYVERWPEGPEYCCAICGYRGYGAGFVALDVPAGQYARCMDCGEVVASKVAQRCKDCAARVMKGKSLAMNKAHYRTRGHMTKAPNGGALSR